MIKEIIAIACDECNGAGFVFFTDGENYDVESCDCVTETSNELDWVNN